MTLGAVRSTAGGELAEAFAALRAELAPEPFPAEAAATDYFSAAVEAEAQRAVAAAELPTPSLLEIAFITIDPIGSTDLDQALHLERAGEGYLARYAIADVPAFVTPGGAIDTEARRRGQTLYAPDGRIPLHPTLISEGAASLLEGQERGAFVWTFELDPAAEVTGLTLERARIRSRRQASYEEVQAELDAADAGGPAEGADEVLLLLREIGIKRIALERARGGASLNRPSQQIDEVDGHYVLTRRNTLPVEDWNAQLSLMTGMAAAELMLRGGVGILRTMPAPDAETIERFRRQTEALGRPWVEAMPYGEYLRSLQPDDPAQPAIIQAAAALFRGAGYTVIDGVPDAPPVQAAMGAPYAHVTAPLRRLVDRFALLICEALAAGTPVADWVLEALPSLPGAMAASGQLASRLENGAISAIEAAVLSERVGESFEATVISAKAERGTIQLSEPAVTAECEGALVPGERITVTLLTAEIATGTVLFRVQSGASGP